MSTTAYQLEIYKETEFLLDREGRLAEKEPLTEDELAHGDAEELLARRAGFSHEQLARFLAARYDLPYIGKIDSGTVDPNAVGLVPAELARKHLFLPLFLVNDHLIVAISSPRTLGILNHIARRVRYPIDPVMTTPQEIDLAITDFYKAIDGFEEDHQDHDDSARVEVYQLDHDRDVDESGIVRLVNVVLRQGIDDGVSDIHIDPTERTLTVRFRVAGVLEDVTRFSSSMAAGFVSRIKILAGMDIAERRIPQDGRIGLLYKGKKIDFRVSTLPTIMGEKVVLRLLDKSKSLIGLDELGFLPELKQIFRHLISSPHGVFLITGPTGSGKTTTLYTALTSLDAREKNILTFEDPVEYALPGINQTQILPKAGLTFASGLRASLRQDPDVILVGEIRDVETAETVIHAALTGHLVFSTLHTNDAPGTISRLVDMGIEPFLIATALVGVNAQRLVRKICTHCRVAYAADDLIRHELGLEDENLEFSVFRGSGCRRCGGSGYRGQIGIFELMPIEDSMRACVAANAPPGELRERARKLGMLSLWEDGMIKVIRGMTTVEEILRVTTAER